MMFSRKDLVKLIVPLIIEQFLAVTIGMADTIMIAGVGEAAVSGISLVDSINILLINLFSALATGGAVVASQYIGRQDISSACKAAKQLIYASFAVAVVVMIVCLVFNSPLLQLIFGNVETKVMESAETYFWLSAISYPFLALYNSGAALFRAMGNSKISMLTSVAMNLVNVGGNALLIYGFNMGVAGAAIATLVSRVLGAVAMIILIRNRNNKIHVWDIWKVEFQPGMIKNILKIGVPNGFENCIFQLGKILLASLITTFGTASITANAVCNSICGFPLIPASAIGLAMITVVGQCIGAQEYEQAKKYTIQLMSIAIAAIGVLNVVLYLVLDPVLGAYQLSQETTEIARSITLYHCILSTLFWAGSFTLPNALRAANDVKFTMIISVLSVWIFRIGFSYLFAAFTGLGVLGVWVAMTIDWVVRMICFVIRFFSGKWRQKQII